MHTDWYVVTKNVHVQCVDRSALAPWRESLCLHAAFSPPTVADTKAAFLAQYDKPIPPMYSGVIQELLVSQHFMKNSVNYKYNEVRTPHIQDGWTRLCRLWYLVISGSSGIPSSASESSL